MSASLVGSEMCIRDRPGTPSFQHPERRRRLAPLRRGQGPSAPDGPNSLCLLYTSDAADDM
eukprot:14061981-Alexandrium_andersonii.AAC.1